MDIRVTITHNESERFYYVGISAPTFNGTPWESGRSFHYEPGGAVAAFDLAESHADGARAAYRTLSHGGADIPGKDLMRLRMAARKADEPHAPRALSAVNRLADVLVFATTESGPCLTLTDNQAEGFAKAILTGVDDIRANDFESSEWPGITINNKESE